MFGANIGNLRSIMKKTRAMLSQLFKTLVISKPIALFIVFGLFSSCDLPNLYGPPGNLHCQWNLIHDFQHKSLDSLEYYFTSIDTNIVYQDCLINRRFWENDEQYAIYDSTNNEFISMRVISGSNKVLLTNGTFTQNNKLITWNSCSGDTTYKRQVIKRAEEYLDEYTKWKTFN